MWVSEYIARLFQKIQDFFVMSETSPKIEAPVQPKLRVVLVGIGYVPFPFVLQPTNSMTRYARLQRRDVLWKDHARKASEEYTPERYHSSPGCASRWAIFSVYDLTPALDRTSLQCVLWALPFAMRKHI